MATPEPQIIFQAPGLLHRHFREGRRTVPALLAAHADGEVVGGAADDARLVGAQDHLAEPLLGPLRLTELQLDGTQVGDGLVDEILVPELTGDPQRVLTVLEGLLKATALQFLLGDGNLIESFDISTDACPLQEAAAAKADGKPPVIELELVPKQASSYERLGIAANIETGEILATRVVDLFGNETRIAFEGIATNRDPAPDTFSFTPDPDVEVIELLPLPAESTLDSRRGP